jgi:hypothetical protein
MNYAIGWTTEKPRFNSTQRQKTLFSSRRPNRPWGPSSLLSKGCHGIFLRAECGRSMKLTTHSSCTVVKNAWSYVHSSIRVRGVMLYLRTGNFTFSSWFLIKFCCVVIHVMLCSVWWWKSDCRLGTCKTVGCLCTVLRKHIWNKNGKSVHRSSVSIATSYGLDGRGSIPGSGKRFFSTPQCPDRL